MPSGYTAAFPQNIILDMAVLYYKAYGGGSTTKFGVSRGGIRFEPTIEWRHVEFDGLRSQIEGLHRITNREGRISGTWLIEIPKHWPLVEPGITSAVNGGITTWTPKAASTLLTPNTHYLQDLRMVGTLADGTLAEVFMGRALCTRFAWVTADKDEHLAECEFISVLEDGLAATTTDTAPYVYKDRPTIS